MLFERRWFTRACLYFADVVGEMRLKVYNKRDQLPKSYVNVVTKFPKNSNFTSWTLRWVCPQDPLYCHPLIKTLKKLPALPSLATVEQLIIHEKRGNCVPVYVELPADLITPCMAYLRVAKDSKYSFLLESVINGENVARYSFIGAGEQLLSSRLSYVRLSSGF